MSYTNNNTLIIKLIRKIDKWRSPTPYEKDKNQIKDNHQNESRSGEVIKCRIWVKITLEIYQRNKYTILKRAEVQ